ncbi:MAG: hypothetical protein Q9184_001912 [Pyrenodesmia sp. 2 TL-2023]
MITDSPGPPTIQPGIPALQPSIPTSGVPSLSIPPLHQTSSSRTLDKYTTPFASLPSPDQATAPLSAPEFSPSIMGDKLTPTGLKAGPSSSSIPTSIPFLSELMSQLFSQSSISTLGNAPFSTTTPSSVSSQPAKDRTPSSLGTTAPTPSPPAVTGSNPKDEVLTASMNSVLVYSLNLAPYPGGLGTSGIAGTIKASSPAEDKTQQQSATVYSYNLPPYSTKIPTYVATSARLAPVSMTSGAPGNPSGNAPTDKNFLEQGSVDPTKDAPAIATSTLIPIYSPACLGNAYGGGYAVTPTVSAANPNRTGIAVINPAYGFTYKLEPTQSPAYSAAVVVADTKASLPARTPLPNASRASSGNSAHALEGPQLLNSVTGASTLLTSEPSIATASSGSKSPGSDNLTRVSGASPLTGSAIPGVLSIVPTQGAVPNLSLAPAEGSVIAADQMSSIISGLVDGFRGTSPSGSDVPFGTPSSGTASNAVGTDGTSCTTITTWTTSKSVVTPSAFLLPSTSTQDQPHRAAVAFNTNGSGGVEALAAIHFGSAVNGTLNLAANGSEVAAFQGAAPKVNVTSIVVVTLVIGICFLVGNNMVFDEWSN